MANNESSTPGSTNAPGVAVGSTLGSTVAPGTGSTLSTGGVTPQPRGGTTGGPNATGIGPVAVIRPPNGFQKTVQQYVSGVEKDIPSTSNVLIAGQQVSQAQILAILQPVLDAFAAITVAENAVKQQRLSLSALLPQAHLFVGHLKDALIVQFGRGNPILKDFGIKDASSPKKPKVAAKAAAQVKAKETRTLRSTQGKVEKQSVKFTGEVSPASAVKPTGGSTPGSAPSGATGNGA